MIPWTVLLPLITKGTLEAVSLAEHLWAMIASGKDPTPEDWAILKTRATKTARTKVLEILAETGTPLDSAIAIEMLSKVP